MTTIIRFLKNIKGQGNWTELKLQEMNITCQRIINIILGYIKQELNTDINPILTKRVIQLIVYLKNTLNNINVLVLHPRGLKPTSVKITYLEIKARNKMNKNTNRCLISLNKIMLEKQAGKHEWDLLHSLLSNVCIGCFNKMVLDKQRKNVYINEDWYRGRLVMALKELKSILKGIFGEPEVKNIYSISTGTLKLLYPDKTGKE